MPNLFKSLAFGVFAISLLGGCETSTTSLATSSFSQMDNSRNVLSFADTLDTVLPSVVRIGTVKKNGEGKAGLSGIGSGAVIDAEKGYVLTNAHVVEGSDGVLINMPDGRVLKGRLIGLDTPTVAFANQLDGSLRIYSEFDQNSRRNHAGTTKARIAMNDDSFANAQSVTNSLAFDCPLVFEFLGGNVHIHNGQLQPPHASVLHGLWQMFHLQHLQFMGFNKT